jgi:hypothetical protein
MRRILVTGSRTWTDADAIHQALRSQVSPDEKAVVVHGGAAGADVMAGSSARFLGWRREVHCADWEKHGKAAGFIRNQHMVDLGADVCLAFIKNNSPGATDCAHRAEKAGIPVHYVREEGR